MKILFRIRNLLLRKLNEFKSANKLKAFTAIEQYKKENLVFCYYDSSKENEVAEIYKQLNGVELSRQHRNLYKSNGNKLLFLVIDEKTKKVVAMDMFYFNPRDIKENTVHEGFIGVLPEYQGQGIATLMRKQAIKHFSKNGLSGISTRISKNNLGSLRSAEKLGFKSVEEYYDEQMQEERYYMICYFDTL